MTQDLIEERFARLELRIAQVDAQLAITRQAVARLEALQAAHAERAARCNTCGAAGDLERVVSWNLSGGSQNAEYQCTDAAACNARRFPDLATVIARLDALEERQADAGERTTGLEARATVVEAGVTHLAGRVDGLAAPLPDCACGHWEAGHCDRKDGTRPCGYTGCRCAAYTPAPAAPVLEAPALAGSCATGGPHEPCSVPFLCGCVCHVTADDNGEHPGDVEAAAGSLPWAIADDASRWTAALPDGRTAVIERLDDGESFLPRVGEAVGPVCAGVLGAAAWVWNYAGIA